MYDMIAKIVAKVKTLPEAVTAFKESIVNAIGDAVTGLASVEYVNTAVTGLASEEYVGTAIGNAVNAIDLGAITTTAGLKTAIENAVASKPIGNIIPIKFSVATAFDKLTYTGIYSGYVFRNNSAKIVGFVSCVGTQSGSTLTVRISMGTDGFITSVFSGRESIGIHSAQPIEIGASVAIDAEASVALPTGYTYTNTRVLSCYLLVNNTQYGEGYVHWYISSDNKLHAINKSGSVGSIQAFIARLL